MRRKDRVNIDILRHLTILIRRDFVEHELAFIVLANHSLVILPLFVFLLRLVLLLDIVYTDRSPGLRII